jgi:sporulation integral membrane protein YtvI
MTEEQSRRERILKNLLNVGIFAAKVLLILLTGPWLVRFFLPVIIGWLIAQLANPLVKFLEKRLHIVRKHSSFGIIIGTILLIVLVSYYLIVWLFREAWKLMASLPDYYQALVQGLDRIAENLHGVAERISPEVTQQISDLREYVTSNLGRIVGSLGSGTVEAAGNIPSVLVSFLFALLFAYFFIAQRDRIHRVIQKIIPKETSERLKMILDRMKYAIGGYFRAQFKIMFVVFLILVVGFAILRIDYGILLAVLIAFLDFLPMLGTGTALIPWALFLALSGSWGRAAGLMILYAVTQVTRQLIQPKMVGDSIGVDTLTTLFFLFIGWRLGGITGMILAIPIGVILIQLYEAGAFDLVLQSVRELYQDIHSWRTGGKNKNL